MSAVEQQAAMIGIDWGTTNMRAALLDSNGSVLEERHGESGIGSDAPAALSARFDAITHGWPDVPAVMAGMIGSRQGWREVRYFDCPARPEDLADALDWFDHRERPITIVPGLKVDTQSHADVMRGEETQLAGLAAARPGFTGTAIMPGTHSKWVQMRDGRIETFRTFMTGEVFEALSRHTMLRHSVTVPEFDISGEMTTFADAFESAAVRGAPILGNLFGLRADGLLHGTEPARLWARLSGFLIGAEFAAARQFGFSLDGELALIGTGKLVTLYSEGLRHLGKSAECHDGTQMVWRAFGAIMANSKIVAENVR